MKNYKLLSLIALTAAFSCSPNNEDGQSGNTPVEKYGALKVSGIQLCAQNGKAVQLRGMSTHGLQWFGKCQTEEAYRSLAEEWQCDVVRLALYAEENGYNTDPLKFRNKIETLVGYCENTACTASSTGTYSIRAIRTIPNTTLRTISSHGRPKNSPANPMCCMKSATNPTATR